jgi:hypothetical protein
MEEIKDADKERNSIIHSDLIKISRYDEGDVNANESGKIKNEMKKESKIYLNRKTTKNFIGLCLQMNQPYDFIKFRISKSSLDMVNEELKNFINNIPECISLELDRYSKKKRKEIIKKEKN